MKNRTTTPRELTASILDFCSSISRDSTPIYLPVPSLGSEDEYQNCFENVEKRFRNAVANRYLDGLSGYSPIL